MALLLTTADENGDRMLGGLRTYRDPNAETLLRWLRQAAAGPTRAGAGEPASSDPALAERIALAIDEVAGLVGRANLGAGATTAEAEANPVEAVLLAAVGALQARKTGAAVRMILHYFDDIDTAQLTLACRRLADALDDLVPDAGRG